MQEGLYNEDFFKTLLKEATKKFKYNIQNQNINDLLEDIRNSKNFRGTIDEFYKPVYDRNGMFGLGGGLTAAGTGPSRSYYMSNHDFLYSNSFEVDPNYPNKPEVQPIILNEFQPDQIIYLNDILASVGSKLFDKLKGDGDKKELSLGQKFLTFLRR